MNLNELADCYVQEFTWSISCVSITDCAQHIDKESVTHHMSNHRRGFFIIKNNKKVKYFLLFKVILFVKKSRLLW